MDRLSSCNIYVIQQDTQCFMITFIHNIWWLDMFRTSIVHPQERFQAVCCKFGMWHRNLRTTRYVQMLCGCRKDASSSYNRITSGRIE